MRLVKEPRVVFFSMWEQSSDWGWYDSKSADECDSDPWKNYQLGYASHCWSQQPTSWQSNAQQNDQWSNRSWKWQEWKWQEWNFEEEEDTLKEKESGILHNSSTGGSCQRQPEVEEPVPELETEQKEPIIMTEDASAVVSVHSDSEDSESEKSCCEVDALSQNYSTFTGKSHCCRRMLSWGRHFFRTEKFQSASNNHVTLTRSTRWRTARSMDEKKFQ